MTTAAQRTNAGHTATDTATPFRMDQERRRLIQARDEEVRNVLTLEPLDKQAALIDAINIITNQALGKLDAIESNCSRCSYSEAMKVTDNARAALCEIRVKPIERNETNALFASLETAVEIAGQHLPKAISGAVAVGTTYTVFKAQKKAAVNSVQLAEKALAQAKHVSNEMHTATIAADRIWDELQDDVLKKSSKVKDTAKNMLQKAELGGSSLLNSAKHTIEGVDTAAKSANQLFSTIGNIRSGAIDAAWSTATITADAQKKKALLAKSRQVVQDLTTAFGEAGTVYDDLIENGLSRAHMTKVQARSMVKRVEKDASSIVHHAKQAHASINLVQTSVDNLCDHLDELRRTAKNVVESAERALLTANKKAAAVVTPVAIAVGAGIASGTAANAAILGVKTVGSLAMKGLSIPGQVVLSSSEGGAADLPPSDQPDISMAFLAPTPPPLKVTKQYGKQML